VRGCGEPHTVARQQQQQQQPQHLATASEACAGAAAGPLAHPLRHLAAAFPRCSSVTLTDATPAHDAPGEPDWLAAAATATKANTTLPAATMAAVAVANETLRHLGQLTALTRLCLERRASYSKAAPQRRALLAALAGLHQQGGSDQEGQAGQGDGATQLPQPRDTAVLADTPVAVHPQPQPQQHAQPQPQLLQGLRCLRLQNLELPAAALLAGCLRSLGGLRELVLHAGMDSKLQVRLRLCVLCVGVAAG
jgi:hypothetical protein